MSIQIVTLNELQGEQKKQIIASVNEIFFLSSSKKEFASQEAKAAFLKRWCGDYQEFFAGEFFVAMEGEKVMGYLSGCSDSLSAEPRLSVPGYSIFHDQFENFPAHLHINFHPDARGKGLGSVLVLHYMKVLKQNGIKGLHLVTSPDAKNVSFYERLGFNHTVTREFKEMPLYFMGSILG